jgi:hypothetical protein
MGGCCAEGRITDIRDARMEEKSGKFGGMEATFERGHGPEGAVVPWMDGRMDGFYSIGTIPPMRFDLFWVIFRE